MGQFADELIEVFGRAASAQVGFVLPFTNVR